MAKMTGRRPRKTRNLTRDFIDGRISVQEFFARAIVGQGGRAECFEDKIIAILPSGTPLHITVTLPEKEK